MLSPSEAISEPVVVLKHSLYTWKVVGRELLCVVVFVLAVDVWMFASEDKNICKRKKKKKVLGNEPDRHERTHTPTHTNNETLWARWPTINRTDAESRARTSLANHLCCGEAGGV